MLQAHIVLGICVALKQQETLTFSFRLEFIDMFTVSKVEVVLDLKVLDTELRGV